MSYIQDRLGNHIEILSGYAYKSKDFEKSGIPVIKIKNVTPPCVSLEDLSYVSEEVAFETKRYILNYADVLIALTGSHINQMSSVVGRVARINFHEKAVLNQRVGKIIPFSDCDLDYVYYYLSQEDVKVSLASKAGGAANQANISPTDVKNLMIPFPDINIQSRISSILRTYDDLIENNQRQIKLLEEAAQRLYKEWFVDLRYPGHENVPVVDGVPEGWERKTMADVCQAIGGGTPSTAKKEYYEGGTIRWVTPTDLTRTGSWILLDTEKKITKEGLDNSSAKMLPPYTVLMTSRASIGYIALCKHEVCTNQGFISCVPFDEKVRYYLMFNLLNRVDEIKSKATGSTFLEITKRTFKELEIIKPPEETISSFNTVIIPMINRMELLFQQTELLSTARDRLLPKLMSGEIAV